AAGTRDNAIVGGRVALTAGTGIGNGENGALTLDADQLNAQSQAGDVRLTLADATRLDSATTATGNIDVAVKQGDLTVGGVRAGGNVNLAVAAGNLVDDGDASTRIAGQGVTLSAVNGIGAPASAMQTQAGTLTASLAGNGGIYINELDGLDGLTASTPNGDVRIASTTGNLTVNSVTGNQVDLTAQAGAIRDGDNGAANNITARQLQLTAATGIGQAGNALDVTTGQVRATGGTGGVYLNSLGKGGLTVES